MISLLLKRGEFSIRNKFNLGWLASSFLREIKKLKMQIELHILWPLIIIFYLILCWLTKKQKKPTSFLYQKHLKGDAYHF
jgi:hypothetical protein